MILKAKHAHKQHSSLLVDSVFLSDKLLHQDNVLEMDHKALASNESRLYIYSKMPKLFGDESASQKYLGYVEVHLCPVSRFFDRHWFRERGANDNDIVADLNTFEPLEKAPGFKKLGIGGRVMDLVLAKLDEQGVRWVFCFTGREEMQGLLNSRKFDQQGDNWFKEIPQ